MTDISTRNEQSKKLLQQYEELRNLMVRMKYDMEGIQETQKKLTAKEEELSARIETLLQKTTELEKRNTNLARVPVMESSNLEAQAKSKKSQDESSSDSVLVKFFQAKGLEVVDKRSSGGALWVTGDARLLKSAVDEAQKNYHVDGTYGTGRAIHQQPGWYTKSEK